MAESIIDAAIKWARMGVPVFPCAMNKAPMTPNGHKDGTTDEEAIRRMFGLAGNCLIGATMGTSSGLFACDFDLYKPGGEAYMQSLSDKGLLNDTQVHTTQSGGVHLLYRGDSVFPNCKPHSTCEVKGEGGYIIVPPSQGYEIQSRGIAYASPKLIDELLLAKSTQSSQTVDVLKATVLRGESFHDPLTQISARRSAQGWPPERVQKELLDVLMASIASNEGHERHLRWKALVNDEKQELTRIVGTGNDKFNPNARSEKIFDKVDLSAIRDLRLCDVGFFGVSTDPAPLEDLQHRLLPDDLTVPSEGELGEEWPFGSSGYFSREHRDIFSQRYVMYPLIAERETMVFAAEPKVGKTAVALKLAMCVARGESLDEKLAVHEPRPVLYFSLEGARAVEMRLEAERLAKKEKGEEIPENDMLFVVDRPHDFLHPEQQVENCQKIVNHNAMCQREFGTDLGFIVIDTFTKAMPGGDQNSVEDTSKLFKMVDLLRAAGVKATICFIHHLSKQGGVRGSTNIEAEVDVVLGLERHKTQANTVIANIRRARSMDEANVYAFRLESVYLGETTQGFHLHAPAVSFVGATDEGTVAQGVRDATQWADVNTKLIEQLGVGKHEVHAIVDALSDYVERPKGKRPNYLQSSVQKPLRALFKGQHTWGWDNTYHLMLERVGDNILSIEIKR